LSERVRELALEITQDAKSSAEKLRALERYLGQNGHYTDEPPQVDPEGDISPVEEFLFSGLSGHCEYFASAMVVLARSLSIPTRLVNGFAGGRDNSVGGFRELRRSDAHSWVEAHYAKAGWVRYDPTPSDSRAAAALSLSWRERFEEFASAAELLRYQRVVGYDRADQIYALECMWLRWKERQTRRESAQAFDKDTSPSLSPEDGFAPLALSGLALLLAAVWMFRSRKRRTEASGVPTWYSEALRLLAKRGLARRPASSARAYSREVSAALPRVPGERFAALTECYLLERFGGRPAPSAPGLLAALRAGLDATRRG